MANYSLVINSKFRPFEYQELLAPVLMATQAHQAVEDAYADLSTKASIWDKMANETTDPKAHAIYKRYADDLQSYSDQLAQQGLTPTSRQAMLNMRSRYAQDIVPIENAYRRKQAQMEEQRKALLQNPTLLLSRRAANTSLDDYLDNPNLDYENYSGALLTSQVASQAASLAKELTSYGNGKPLDRFTSTFLKQHGFTRDQVLRAISNPADPESSAVLNAIVETTINSSGILDWADGETARRGYNYARQGLWSAVGQSDISTYENKGAIMSQQLANQKALAKYQQGLADGSQQKARLKMYDINPTAYFSADEVSKTNNEVAKQLDSFRKAGYFSYDGKLTKRGLKALSPIKIDPTYSSYEEPGILKGGRQKTPISISPTPFHKWALSLGIDLENPNIRDINTAYQTQRKAITSGEMATGVANFQVYRQRLGSSAERNLIADNLLNVIGEDGVIHEAGQLSNGTITPGKSYDANAFREAIGYTGKSGENANILYIANAPTVGDAGQQFVELTNGKKFLIPSGEQFFGLQTYRDLQGANTKVRNAKSIAEVATNLNMANSYVAAPLTTVGGAEIKPNDGTVTIDLLDLLDR